MSKVLGIDVGGTKIHAAVYESSRWNLVEERRILTNAEQGLANVLMQVKELIRDFEKDHQFEYVGLGLPGYIDMDVGVIYRTPNIPMNDPINVYNFFSEYNLVVDNDANLFAYAEFEMNWRGKVKHMLGLTIGTGLGGGIIINEQLYHGRDGFASEFGHMAFTEEKVFEDFVSGKGSELTWGKYLGVIVSNLVHAFNPEAILLGGSIGKQFGSYERETWAEIRRRTLKQSTDKLILEATHLEHPSTLGAALLVYNSFKDA